MESLRTLLLFVVCFTAPAPCVCQIYPEGCLDCWYRACNEFDTNFNSGAFRIDCCYCVLDESADIDLERCATQLTLYYRMANVVRNECCSNARDRFLTYDAFVEDSPPADTELCRGGPLFNSPETVSDRQLGPGASLDREEYLLPQYTFECSGCIENFTILVSAPETPVIQEGNVTVKLWSSIRSSLQGSSTFYRLNGSTSFVASPQVDPPAGRGSTGRWLVTFGLPSSKPLCFVEGHTLGFSLKEHPIASLTDIGTALTVLDFSTENKTQNVMVPYVDDDCELNGLFEARSSSKVNQLPWIAVGAVELEAPTMSVSPTTTPSITYLPPSNIVNSNTTDVNATALPIVLIAGVAGGGAALLLVGLLICLICCCMCCTRESQLVDEKTVMEMDTMVATRGIHRLRSLRMDGLVQARSQQQETSMAATNPLAISPPNDPLYEQPPESGQILSPDPDLLVTSRIGHQYHVLDGLDRPLGGPADGKAKQMPQSREAEIRPRQPSQSSKEAYDESKYMTMRPEGSLSHRRALSVDGDESVLEMFSTSQSTLDTSADDLDEFSHDTSHYDVPNSLANCPPPLPGDPASHLYHELDPTPQLQPSQTLPMQEYDLPTALSRTPQRSRKYNRSNSQPQNHPYHVLEIPSKEESTTQTKPFYHVLETDSPRQGRSYSYTADEGRHVHIFDTGVYVPSIEERLKLVNEPRAEITTETYNHWSKVAPGPHYALSIYDHNPQKQHRQSFKRKGFFAHADSFWQPESQEWQLYEQLSKKKYREILRSQIEMAERLGAGQFGSVMKAIWNYPGGSREVAAKTMRPTMQEGARVRFLQEAAIMGQFFHPNILKLHGVVTVGEPAIIVVELMPLGDLSSYLSNTFEPEVNPPNAKDFLSFCRQIACGMKYLVNKGFVHRDLAARNILLNEALVCKISDFGMSRGLQDCDIYKSRGGQVPIKWTAPEALLYKKFSEKSDVYSYGMVLYEIWSVGRKPFPSKSAQEVIRLAQKGYCQSPPPGTPREVYALMVQCWDPNESHRLTFAGIQEYLTASDESLLAWSSQDRGVSPRVMELGAPLLEACDLYSDLQHMYYSGTDREYS